MFVTVAVLVAVVLLILDRSKSTHPFSQSVLNYYFAFLRNTFNFWPIIFFFKKLRKLREAKELVSIFLLIFLTLYVDLVSAKGSLFPWLMYGRVLQRRSFMVMLLVLPQMVFSVAIVDSIAHTDNIPRIITNSNYSFF